MKTAEKERTAAGWGDLILVLIGVAVMFVVAATVLINLGPTGAGLLKVTSLFVLGFIGISLLVAALISRMCGRRGTPREDDIWS